MTIDGHNLNINVLVTTTAMLKTKQIKKLI